MRDIVDVLNDGAPQEPHHWTLLGHETLTGVEDRWGWSCRCGSKSANRRMTIAQAKLDWRHHKDGAR